MRQPDPRPRAFIEREREILQRHGGGTYPTMHCLAELMLLNVDWQMDRLRKRLGGEKGVLSKADDGQAFRIQRRLSVAFLHIAEVHAELDQIEKEA